VIILDQIKTGILIKKFRTASGLTQKQLAESLNVSDKAVSKWECGNGCPDISLLSQIADIFGTDIRSLLTGEINKNEREKGNMKKLRFYVCKECGNIITSSSDTDITCCGNKLSPLEPQKAEDNDRLITEDIGGEWSVTSEHEMTKEHYISFVAYVSDSAAMLFKQYPEWGVQVHLPLYRSGRLVWYCTKHGLFYQDIRRDPPTKK